MKSKKMTQLTLFYRRESHGSKTPQPGPPQRKPSTDSIEKYFNYLFILSIVESCRLRFMMFGDDYLTFNLAEIHSF